jgi:hypothetical protein
MGSWLRAYRIKIALILIITRDADDDINRNAQTIIEAKEKGIAAAKPGCPRFKLNCEKHYRSDRGYCLRVTRPGSMRDEIRRINTG